MKGKKWRAGYFGLSKSTLDLALIHFRPSFNFKVVDVFISRQNQNLFRCKRQLWKPQNSGDQIWNDEAA